MTTAREEQNSAQSKARGEQLCRPWRKREFVTPVDDISAHYTARFFYILTKKLPVVRPTCNVHSQLCRFVLLLPKGFWRVLKLSVSRTLFQKNIRLLVFFHSFPPPQLSLLCIKLCARELQTSYLQLYSVSELVFRHVSGPCCTSPLVYY